MRITRFLLLFLLALFICVDVNAQICGPSKTKIYVRDNKGNLVTNVKFEFVGLSENKHWGNWLTFKDGAYFIFFERYKPSGNHVLKISVQGFVTSEIAIRISEAQYQIFNLILKRKGVNEHSYLQEMLLFWGEIKDANNAAISNAKVTLTNKDGRKLKTLTSEKGGYDIEVQEGIYDVEILGTEGFASAKYENFEISKMQNHLDATLEVDSNCNCLITELVCKPHKYLANEFDCVLVTRNPRKKN